VISDIGVPMLVPSASRHFAALGSPARVSIIFDGIIVAVAVFTVITGLARRSPRLAGRNGDRGHRRRHGGARLPGRWRGRYSRPRSLFDHPAG
jgi:hypothetical protein